MAISGRLLADVRRFPSGCSGLLEVDRVEARGVEGRTELQLPECPAPLLQGWRVQVIGVLRRPLPAVHPLLPGSAERLARQGSWSQLRAESIEVLQRPWTPLADLRRDVAQRLQQAVGPRRGGFLAALVHGHARLDWVLLLDPVATDVLACWQALAHSVEAPQQGQAPLAIGQVLRSDGLSVQRLQSRSGALVMRVGHQRWQLVPSPQALWALQQRQRSEPRQMITGTWLGFKPSAPQRRWLLKHGAGARFVGL